ncbi:MAG: nitroreductase family protein [Candidatus Geothermincolia bacterium]
MSEPKPSKAPTRDYQSFSSTPWNILGTMYARRSHRKYLPAESDPALAEDLDALLDLACEARGASRESVIAINDPGLLDAVKKAAGKGLAGKINIWLPRAPLTAALLVNLPEEDVHADRPVELPKTVIALEDAVLWLTERGVGTCWLAGVSERELIKAAGLGKGRSVPAMISIGKPAPGAPRAVSYSGVSYNMMSRRRKPLSKIACVEDAGVAYAVAGIPQDLFEASGEGVAGLLRLMKGAGVPRKGTLAGIELAVDVCLEAARVAPSGNNAQAWLFVVLRDGERLSSLADLCGRAGQCPWKAAIVATGQGRKFENMMLDRPFWDLDVPIAMSHISLAGASAGYAADVLTGGIDEPGIARLVNLPSGMRVAGVVGLT